MHHSLWKEGGLLHLPFSDSKRHCFVRVKVHIEIFFMDNETHPYDVTHMESEYCYLRLAKLPLGKGQHGISCCTPHGSISGYKI